MKRKPYRKTYWTRERVIFGLQLFYRELEFTPLSTEEYHEIVKSGAKAPYRRLPSMYAITKYFKTMREAWIAAGVLVDRSWEPWDEIEDWYLYEATGIIPRAEIAYDLRRTDGSVKRRLYDLGLDARTRWGWTIHRVSEHTQIPAHRFSGYLERGELAYFRGNQFIYVDPADLLEIPIIDWNRVTAELTAEIRKSLMDRAVKTISGIDWRAMRPQQSHQSRKTCRRNNRKQIEPPPIPYELKRGDIVEVVEQDEDHNLSLNRRGVVHLVQFVRGRTRKSRWRARVEFKGRKNPDEKRASYSLPLSILRKVEPSADDPSLEKSPKKRRGPGRKERLYAESVRLARRDERRAEVAKLSTPFRGRQSGKR